jgi:hypothetical protein
MSAVADFWRHCDEYHELVEEYDRHCVVTHPNYVTGSKACWICYECPWAATSVTYYEYRGPSVTSLTNR